MGKRREYVEGSSFPPFALPMRGLLDILETELV